MHQTRLVHATFLALCNVALLVMYGLLKSSDLVGNDFLKYYVLSHRVRYHESVYDPVRVDAHLEPFILKATNSERVDAATLTLVRPSDPPPLVLFTWPLGQLSYTTAWWSLLLSSLLIVVGTVYRVGKELGAAPLQRATWLAVSLGALPTLVNGLLNHIEPFVWAAMTWGWLQLRQGNEKRAGILIGLAGALKLFPLAVVPMLFAAGYRRGSVVALIAALVAFLMPIAIIGSDSMLVFLREVIPQSTQYRVSLGNVSAISFLSMFLPVRVALLVVGGFLAWTIAACRRYRSPDQVFVIGVSAALLCSPLSWTYYLILALPCVMIANLWLGGSRPGRSKVWLIFLYATIVYWPCILGGILAGWLGEVGLPLLLITGLNFVPTIGLFVLWALPQMSFVLDLPPSGVAARRQSS